MVDEAHSSWQPMRLLAYCIMPNHWHLVLWPYQDGDLSEYDGDTGIEPVAEGACLADHR